MQYIIFKNVYLYLSVATAIINNTDCACAISFISI